MTNSIEQITEEYGIRFNEHPRTINGSIPEWALPSAVVEQYKNWEGASDSFDDCELAVMQASSAFNKAKGLDEQAIRDAIVSRQPVPGHEHEAAAEKELKRALTTQRMTAKVVNEEARKLVALMRQHRGEIHAAMEQRVHALTPKIRNVLNEFEAKLQPLYKELAEAMTPVELLRTLDTRQSEDIGAATRYVSTPDIMSSRNHLRSYEQLIEDLARSSAPTRIRLKDPHGNIGEHDLIGTNEKITQSLQLHIETLKKNGWKEVPWD